MRFVTILCTVICIGGNIFYKEGETHVTVLDAGITTSLEKASFAPFGKFLYALCSGGVDDTVKYLNYFNKAAATVNSINLKKEIQSTMDKFVGPLCQELVNAADMFVEVMFSMQKHGMRLKGDVVATLCTMSMNKGLARQLDPKFDVASKAIDYIMTHMHVALCGINTHSE